MPISRRAPKRGGPTRNALPDALVRRFADDARRLIGANETARIGIAVSGGPDSLALLLLANAAFPDLVEAATVDHRLRAGSANEAMLVTEICASRGILHAVLPLDALPKGNISAAARAARYAALTTWADARDLDWIMTGHHADDQRETMIMRMNRGSGVAGLSGARARQGRIVRPLLHWRHDELVALVADAGIAAVDDPTNHDDSYDRARLRKALRNADWLDAQAISVSADALADADVALEWATDRLEAVHVTQKGTDVTFARGSEAIPAELTRRLVLRCLRRIDPTCQPRGAALSRLITQLENGATATLGSVVARRDDGWHFAPARPRRPMISS